MSFYPLVLRGILTQRLFAQLLAAVLCKSIECFYVEVCAIIPYFCAAQKLLPVFAAVVIESNQQYTYIIKLVFCVPNVFMRRNCLCVHPSKFVICIPIVFMMCNCSCVLSSFYRLSIVHIDCTCTMYMCTCTY